MRRRKRAAETQEGAGGLFFTAEDETEEQKEADEDAEEEEGEERGIRGGGGEEEERRRGELAGGGDVPSGRSRPGTRVPAVDHHARPSLIIDQPPTLICPSNTPCGPKPPPKGVLSQSDRNPPFPAPHTYKRKGRLAAHPNPGT